MAIACDRHHEMDGSMKMASHRLSVSGIAGDGSVRGSLLQLDLCDTCFGLLTTWLNGLGEFTKRRQFCNEVFVNGDDTIIGVCREPFGTEHSHADGMGLAHLDWTDGGLQDHLASTGAMFFMED